MNTKSQTLNLNPKPLDQVFDLMCNLGATDKQLEYATIYASGRYFFYFIFFFMTLEKEEATSCGLLLRRNGSKEEEEQLLLPLYYFRAYS